METWYYEVVSDRWRLRELKRTDIPSEDLKLMARALLPAENIWRKQIEAELMQYEIMQTSVG